MHTCIIPRVVLCICRGWINALTVVGTNAAAGAAMLFVALLFSLCAAGDIILLIKVGYAAFHTSRQSELSRIPYQFKILSLFQWLAMMINSLHAG